MERPADLELGRLATPEEDCEYDEPEVEEKKVEQKEEEKETDETVTKEEKEQAVGEVVEEEEEEEEDVKKGEKVSLLEGRASPPLSSANTSMNTSGETKSKSRNLFSCTKLLLVFDIGVVYLVLRWCIWYFPSTNFTQSQELL